MRAQRFAAPKGQEGVDCRQFLCGTLHNELLFLQYASGHDEDQAKCLNCRQPRPKWGWCENPECRTRSYFLNRLIEVVTFFESEFPMHLCSWTGINYNAYIERSKELFSKIPPERQEIALNGAAEWWKDRPQPI